MREAPVRRPVLLAALTAFAVRALTLARFRVPPVNDGVHTLALAESLAHAHRFADAVHLTARSPVGYPAVVASAMLLGVHGIDAARAVNVFASTVAAGLAAVLGHRVAGARGAYVAGLVAALEPGAALFCTAADGAAVLGALLAAMLAVVTLRARSERTVALAAGWVTGGAALVSPHVLFLAPWVGATAAPRGTHRLGTLALAVAGALLLVAPWGARNAHAVGAWVLTTTSGAELLAGTFDEGRDSRNLVMLACPASPSERARDVCAVRVARLRIAADPVAWAQRALGRIAETEGLETDPAAFLSAGLGSLDARHERRIGAVCTVAWWIVIVSAFIGARRALRHGGRPLAIAQLAIGLCVIEVLARLFGPPGDRFHLALVPVLAPLCSGVLLPARPIDADPELAWVT